MCKQTINGEEVLGLRLNFEKRWITLAPIATVVGLAFRLFDPENCWVTKKTVALPWR
ncbi:hypothetical protein HSBAA_27470 [Vreelandella sulfidaeris]|uniref:Uncharacterized protein n=1 Tax=Vreelandella sulfidaeris TaxID=115553 RepID=A0A455UA45_9GAMM|nr:hypothetical protein HSBAA_27470 [Halomonas sulfidaeris]